MLTKSYNNELKTMGVAIDTFVKMKNYNLKYHYTCVIPHLLNEFMQLDNTVLWDKYLCALWYELNRYTLCKDVHEPIFLFWAYIDQVRLRVCTKTVILCLLPSNSGLHEHVTVDTSLTADIARRTITNWGKICGYYNVNTSGMWHSSNFDVEILLDDSDSFALFLYTLIYDL